MKAGDLFDSRHEIYRQGWHTRTIHGISVRGGVCDAIALNGGYKNTDDGWRIEYVGEGGFRNKVQVADQTLTGGNLALAQCVRDRNPVRVFRGPKSSAMFRPDSGYRYDGLYQVVRFWSEEGDNGFNLWKFELVQEHPEHRYWKVGLDNEDLFQPPTRTTVTSSRVVRDPNVARNVKEFHANRCQVCGIALQTATGLYAEAAHITPLGQPTNGPDAESNVLCLCPNHHVMLDDGGIVVTSDLSIIETTSGNVIGHLRTTASHQINVRHFSDHMVRWRQDY